MYQVFLGVAPWDKKNGPVSNPLGTIIVLCFLYRYLKQGSQGASERLFFFFLQNTFKLSVNIFELKCLSVGKKLYCEPLRPSTVKLSEYNLHFPSPRYYLIYEGSMQH